MECAWIFILSHKHLFLADVPISFLVLHTHTTLPQNVGTCVTQVEPRTQIAPTGILTALDQLQQHQGADDLSPAKVEFLQACLYADPQQCAFGEQQIYHTWPRPNKHKFPSTTTVQQVLRYYYLRGVVHMHCHNWKMAVRCFWTCLAVPSSSDSSGGGGGPSSSNHNVVSAIAVAAWKKLVLVQCVMADSLEYCSSSSSGGGDDNTRVVSAEAATVATKKTSKSSSTTELMPHFVAAAFSPSTTSFSPPRSGPLSTPKEMPNSLSRFLNTARPPPGSRSVGNSGTGDGDDTDSPMTSPRRGPPAAPEEHPEAMHMVEMESNDDVMAMVLGGGGGDDPNRNNNNNASSSQYPSLGVRVYRELVQAFLSVDRTAFDAIAEEHANLFRDDGNWGFVVHHVGATVLRHRQVYAVSSLYAALPLSQLVTELQLATAAEAQALLQQLATERAWPVRIEGDGMVVFPRLPPGPAVTLEPEELVQLTKTVRELDVAVAASPKYSAFLRKNASGGGGKTDRSGSGGLGGPRGVEDI